MGFKRTKYSVSKTSGVGLLLMLLMGGFSLMAAPINGSVSLDISTTFEAESSGIFEEVRETFEETKLEAEHRGSIGDGTLQRAELEASEGGEDDSKTAWSEASAGTEAKLSQQGLLEDSLIAQSEGEIESEMGVEGRLDLEGGVGAEGGVVSGSPIPEPKEAVLLGIALIAAGFGMWRRAAFHCGNRQP